MRRQKLFKGMSAAIIASMLIQGGALAAPKDELQEIIEKQEAQASETLLSKTLGSKELSEKISKEGITVSGLLGLTPETLQTLGLDEILPENPSLSYGCVIDKINEAWAFSVGANLGDEEILSVDLFGNTQMLALAIPQFLSNTISLSSGNLKDQLEGSALAELMGQDLSQIPDINLSFYPSGQGLALSSEIMAKAEALSENMEVEKTDGTDYTMYTATIKTSDYLDIYRAMMDTYVEPLAQSNIVSVAEIGGFESQIEEVCSALETMLGETVSVDFLVMDGNIAEISYMLNIDTTEFADAQVVEPETDDPTTPGQLSAEVTASPMKGFISYDITFVDPADITKGMEMFVYAEDEQSEQNAVVKLSMWNNQYEDNKEDYVVSLWVQQGEETLLDAELLHASFDAETGDLDAEIGFDAEGSKVGIALDSTITDIVAGECYTWNIDSLKFDGDGASVGVNGEVYVSGGEKDLQAPENTKDILALDQGGLVGIISEAAVNVQKWVEQFQPAE